MDPPDIPDYAMWCDICNKEHATWFCHVCGYTICANCKCQCPKNNWKPKEIDNQKGEHMNGLKFGTHLQNVNGLLPVLKGIDLLRIKGYNNFLVTTPQATIQLLPELKRRIPGISLTPGIVCDESPFPGYDPYTYFMWSKYYANAKWLSDSLNTSEVVFDQEIMLTPFYNGTNINLASITSALASFVAGGILPVFRHPQLVANRLPETTELMHKLKTTLYSANFICEYRGDFDWEKDDSLRQQTIDDVLYNESYLVDQINVSYNNINQHTPIQAQEYIGEHPNDNIVIWVEPTEWLSVAHAW